jgi:nitric oxide reductase NorD protein
LTRRLLDVPAERRILLSIGDGLPSDQGYEGHYAIGDVAKAVEEADNAGVLVYHIGVGRVHMDPLKETFGEKRSQRVTSIRDLPKILIQVHAGLCAL